VCTQLSLNVQENNLVTAAALHAKQHSGDQLLTQHLRSCHAGACNEGSLESLNDINVHLLQGALTSHQIGQCPSLHGNKEDMQHVSHTHQDIADSPEFMHAVHNSHKAKHG
jgi:predicted transposase YbfD/YdcC